MFQTLVLTLHNDLILQISIGRFSGAQNDEGRFFIGDTSLIKYIPKHIRIIGNRNNITSAFKTIGNI